MPLCMVQGIFLPSTIDLYILINVYLKERNVNAINEWRKPLKEWRAHTYKSCTQSRV